MGCGSSTSSDLVETQLSSYLTRQEVDLVRQSWPVLETDLQACGQLMFVRLFRMYPELKAMFAPLIQKHAAKESWVSAPPGEEGGAAGEASRKALTFSLHGLVFMEALGSAVRCLDDSRSLARRLIKLGKSHVKLNVTAQQLPKLWPAIDQMMSERLGEVYCAETRAAWKKVFAFLVDMMARGIRLQTRLLKTGGAKDNVRDATPRCDRIT